MADARICNWPVCLSAEAAQRLAEECEYSLRGDEHPDPDLTDYRVVHDCVEPQRGDDDPDGF